MVTPFELDASDDGIVIGNPTFITQQAMTNDFDLNMENNMRMRDTHFVGRFWPKTLENQIKC
jgi:hypothetical protein